MKKVLVLGASGFIGKAICQTMGDTYQVFGTYFSNKEKITNTMMVKLDISKDEQIKNVLETVEPDLVISAMRGDFVYQLRAHENLADYLKENGTRLIYLSTANVYDAHTDKAHAESDEVASSSDYGKFKITCEKMLHEKKLGPLLTIVRVPMVYGIESPRVTEILAGLKKKGHLLLFIEITT